MMRKFLVFLHAFLLLGFPSFADSVKVGDFEVEEYGTGAYLDVTITSYSGPGGELAMQVPGRPVTIIGQDVFAGKEITSVELPKTLTEIRDRAFRNNLLETVAFPQALSAIGEGAFEGNDLKEVALPPYLERVGDRAFAGNRITRITIDAGVNLDADAFDHKFADAYLAGGKNAGTYVYRIGRWYLEAEWLAISAMDDDPLDRGPENIEPRAEVPPTINLGLSGVETVTVMDFRVLGPVSVTKQEVLDFGPLGIQKNRSGSRVTWFDLMAEASRLGADDVVNVH
ncbi:MAG: leucine-rich repeat domain-containing protein, partial [Spirochaetia bacterium]|nr:leucine-rich repeat domain-containing protein [Spirochaetia bacterium]